MPELPNIPPQLLALQLLNGLINGAFYALLSLGLAIIFGMLRVVNFAHGAFYMLGAFGTYLLLQWTGIGFWWSLILVPALMGLFGMVVERGLFRWLYPLDPLYNFLLSFGLALILQDAMRLQFGLQGQPYRVPPELNFAINIGVAGLPAYRVFLVVFSLAVCAFVWYLIERTRVGMVVRAATEKPALTRALGIDVDRWVTPVFGFGVAMAALGGVLAAPVRNVSPLMGSELIIEVFAVIVIGGLGSIGGAIVAGFAVGLLQALGSVYFPPIAKTLIYILMAIVLLVRPAGLFGSQEAT